MKSMLDLVSEQCEDLVGDVSGVLGNEEDTDTLGSYELDHLRDPVHPSLGSIIK